VGASPTQPSPATSPLPGPWSGVVWRAPKQPTKRNRLATGRVPSAPVPTKLAWRAEDNEAAYSVKAAKTKVPISTANAKAIRASKNLAIQANAELACSLQHRRPLGR
jgi:hypothetical protein